MKARWSGPGAGDGSMVRGQLGPHHSGPSAHLLPWILTTCRSTPEAPKGATEAGAVSAEAWALDPTHTLDSLQPWGVSPGPAPSLHSPQLASACARHMCPGNPAHSGRWVGRRSPPHLGKAGGDGGVRTRKTQGYHKDPGPQGPPAGPTLTESKENLVLFPLQVELVHPEQGLKLLPADVVQDLLGWGHKGWRLAPSSQSQR